MTMYKKILPLVNRFVYLRQGYFNRYYEGKILEVTPDTLTLQAYDEQGRLDSQWVIALPTVTEFMTGDRDLDELNMKVSMAKTIEQAELSDLEQATLASTSSVVEETTSFIAPVKSTVIYGSGVGSSAFGMPASSNNSTLLPPSSSASFLPTEDEHRSS
jgi:hypothetical protein